MEGCPTAGLAAPPPGPSCPCVTADGRRARACSHVRDVIAQRGRPRPLWKVGTSRCRWQCRARPGPRRPRSCARRRRRRRMLHGGAHNEGAARELRDLEQQNLMLVVGRIAAAAAGREEAVVAGGGRRAPP
jgi:hypothetical protein